MRAVPWARRKRWRGSRLNCLNTCYMCIVHTYAHYTETCGRQLDKEFSSMHQCKVKDVVDVAPLLLPADPKMLSYAGFITAGVSYQ